MRSDATRSATFCFSTTHTTNMCPTCCSSAAALVSTNTTFSATINSIHQKWSFQPCLASCIWKRGEAEIPYCYCWFRCCILLLHFNCLCICVDSVWLFIYIDIFLKSALVYTHLGTYISYAYRATFVLVSANGAAMHSCVRKCIEKRWSTS